MCLAALIYAISLILTSPSPILEIPASIRISLVGYALGSLSFSIMIMLALPEITFSIIEDNMDETDLGLQRSLNKSLIH